MQGQGDRGSTRGFQQDLAQFWQALIALGGADGTVAMYDAHQLSSDINNFTVTRVSVNLTQVSWQQGTGHVQGMGWGLQSCVACSGPLRA